MPIKAQDASEAAFVLVCHFVLRASEALPAPDLLAALDDPANLPRPCPCPGARDRVTPIPSLNLEIRRQTQFGPPQFSP